MQLFGALSDLHFITQPASMCFHTTLRPLHIFKKIYVLASNKTALTHTTSSMHTAPKIASLEFLIHAEMFFFFSFSDKQTVIVASATSALRSRTSRRALPRRVGGDF